MKIFKVTYYIYLKAFYSFHIFYGGAGRNYGNARRHSHDHTCFYVGLRP